jgi:hypothetical protein
VEHIKRISTQAQGLNPGGWLKVRIGAEDDPSGPQFGIVNGPCGFILHVALTTNEGLPVGKSLMLRAVNTTGDPDNVEDVHPIWQSGPTDSGTQHFAYSAQGEVKAGQTLRVQAKTDDSVQITMAETRVTTW